MKNFYFLLLAFSAISYAQTTEAYDDFDGNTNIASWYADNSAVDYPFTNPYQNIDNNSTNVLKYEDTGGEYANFGFNVNPNFDLTTNQTFSFKIYVPSNSVVGLQPNEVTLKLQDGTQAQPWLTQTEIIKPIVLDAWQTVTFNFRDDIYFNLDTNSLPPIQRTDLNRVLIQVNGEGNFDAVTAYIDDFTLYESEEVVREDPVFDQLVWSDEFDVDGAVDAEKWFHQTIIPVGDSWFNGEVQHYTDELENAYVENGALHIVAKRQSYTAQGITKEFTSARLNSKFAFTYGRVEIRAKMPSGVGTWPALWMLGKNVNENGAYWQTLGYGTATWPWCGEIDIMEHWGHNQNYVSSATHTPSSFGGGTVNTGGQTIPTVSTEYHLYELEWYQNKLIFSVDGVEHFTYEPDSMNTSTWPFFRDQFFLFNIALLPTLPNDFTESSMEVDYIRVYQASNLSTTELEEQTQKAVAYPNPVKDELNLSIEGVSNQTISVRIYDVNGKLVRNYAKSVQNGKVTLQDLSNLPKGMYFVNYYVNGEKNSIKLLKK